MSLLMSIGLVVQVLSAIALIVLVLLQHGKGADLGAAFGSGASGSIIGAVFFLSTIAITIGSGAFAHHNARQASDNGGVLGTLSSVPADVSAPAAAPSAPAAAPSAPAASGAAAPAPAASNTADTRNNPTTPSQNEIPR